jgi:ABC-2 type transport system permease protein
VLLTLAPLAAVACSLVSLANPLTYVSEGFRAAVTSSPHLSLLAVYPVLAGFTGVLLWVRLRNFRRRVIA